MKTTSKTTGKLPKPFKLTVYLCAVLLLGSMNWAAIKLEESRKEIRNMESRQDEALVEEQEPELQVEDGMLNLPADYFTGVDDQEIDVESRIVDFEKFVLAENFEEEEQLSDWMLYSICWTCCDLLARK